MLLRRLFSIRRVLVILFALFLPLFFAWLSRTPTHDRDWEIDQAVLPSAEIRGDLAHVRNIRNFRYRSVRDFDIDYYDKTFDLAAIKRVYYIVEPFSMVKGPAHTFLSFEFAGDEFLAVSVEIRKKKGDSFSALRGLFRQYEIMYVLGDERDLIDLRANHRKDDVYVYPVRATPAQARALFLDIIERVNALYAEPEFYNTLTNTCTTNIVRHVHAIAPKRIPYNIAILFPAYSDRFAYNLGLIDTDLSFREARKAFHINEKAAEFADSPDFSVRIRE